LFPALAFAVLCGGNLAIIRVGHKTFPPRTLPLALTLFAILCVAVGRAPWYYAIGLSSIALAILSLTFQITSVTARRVLADVALVTPLFFR
ncbi:MAG TPA: hypothetical protein VNH18_02310, partial [Bryobacteraceae bacterium]|nr:hypothetical protein [Bryobacteraceae bacterium]